MNVAAALQPSIPAELFDEACGRVNQWRGRCLDAFTRAEAAVTECLLVMSGVPKRGAKVSLPLLVGQRYAALEAALAEGGAFAGEGAGALAQLACFREHDALRTALCHGVARVSLDRSGRWTVLLETVSFRSRRADASIFAVAEDRADALRKEVSRSSQVLCSKLSNYRSGLLPKDS